MVPSDPKIWIAIRPLRPQAERESWIAPDTPPAKRRRMWAIKERSRVGHEVFVHFDPHRMDPADRPFGQQFSDVADERVLDVIVPQDRHPARSSRRFGHALGIGKGGSHWFFAPDMLAGPERGDGHFGVEGIGRGYGNNINIGVGDQLAPVACRFGKAQRRGLLCRQIGIGFGEVDKTGALDIAEDRRDGVPGERVALAHIAGSDEADAEGCH